MFFLSFFFFFVVIFFFLDILLILFPVANPGLSVYPKPAVISRPMTLVCSALSEKFNRDMTFKRDNSDICTCSRRTRSCTNHTSSDQYNCTFDYEVKIDKAVSYLLTIEHLTVIETGNWTCCSSRGRKKCSKVIRVYREYSTEIASDLMVVLRRHIGLTVCYNVLNPSLI